MTEATLIAWSAKQDAWTQPETASCTVSRCGARYFKIAKMTGFGPVGD